MKTICSARKDGDNKTPQDQDGLWQQVMFSQGRNSGDISEINPLVKNFSSVIALKVVVDGIPCPNPFGLGIEASDGINILKWEIFFLFSCCYGCVRDSTCQKCEDYMLG